MKFLVFLCAFLLAISLVNANHYGCGTSPCGVGRICHTLRGFCSCVEIVHCLDVNLRSNQMAQWRDNSGVLFTQYDITITNYLNVDITQIFIGTDCTLELRDYESLWNVVRLPNGELTLPSYQHSINKDASYTFGFIVRGDRLPNMAILAVTY
ncbi:hypothetical protein RB653_004514 [Dictyostelium firmibasis]|uniref:Carbohydrate binding domain-containing protein n=1 Tax=Dictyostelium firmibasis TaxID=79012 RepID=A0AAN7U7X6_9MYCE